MSCCKSFVEIAWDFGYQTLHRDTLHILKQVAFIAIILSQFFIPLRASISANWPVYELTDGELVVALNLEHQTWILSWLKHSLREDKLVTVWQFAPYCITLNTAQTINPAVRPRNFITPEQCLIPFFHIIVSRCLPLHLNPADNLNTRLANDVGNQAISIAMDCEPLHSCSSLISIAASSIAADSVTAKQNDDQSNWGPQ